MIAVLQRVFSAAVTADGIPAGKIGKGLYILLGVTKEDTAEDARLLAEKIAKLRIFSDENGKMNLSVNDVDGEVLIVSNFTLSANYSHGNRPEYFGAAAPNVANELYEYFIALMRSLVRNVETGVFGADMTTELATCGPVTIIMDSQILAKKGKG
ncbi:MAG: D-tyrosyl-tRNA(Tyr) deacylase [Clostridia bacterium]|nr:D-tyrosyl-tRNA(Tyr) deacylase [Clostridia bacterium]